MWRGLPRNGCRRPEGSAAHECRKDRRVGREREGRRRRGIEPARVVRVVAGRGCALGSTRRPANQMPTVGRSASWRLVATWTTSPSSTSTPGFLERLACRRLAHVLAPLDVSAGKTPQARTEMARPAPHHQHATRVVLDDDGSADAHVGEEDEAARRAGRPRQSRRACAATARRRTVGTSASRRRESTRTATIPGARRRRRRRRARSGSASRPRRGRGRPARCPARGHPGARWVARP